MPVITISKTYSDGDTLYEADLTGAFDDIENFLNTTKINDDNIQASGITGSTKLVDASVSSAKIASAAVTTSKIDDSAVTTAKIADSNVTTAKIADSNVTTAKIADSNVTTAKIADSNVTFAKISNNVAVSSSLSTQTFNTAGWVDATNLSTTLTSQGNELEVMLIPDNTAAISQTFPTGMYMSGGTYGANSEEAWLRFYDVTAGAEIGGFVLRTVTQNFSYANGVWPPACFYTVYTPAAGSRTIKVQVIGRVGSSTCITYLSHCKLYIRERK